MFAALKKIMTPAARALPENPILMIPARLASTRLPGKPLADIHGLPMIVQVMKRAEEANFGRVVIACIDDEIRAAVEKAGGEAIVTDRSVRTGSDCIQAAMKMIDPKGRHDAVINVQGDLPTLDPRLIRTAFGLLANAETGIGTLAAVITNDEDRRNPNIVKAIAEIDLAAGETAGRALYFTRLEPPASPDWTALHHIGLYAYRREALDRFVTARPSVMERKERLEQLRAMALGIRIDVAVVDTVPLGVDTPEDLEVARGMLA